MSERIPVIGPDLAALPRPQTTFSSDNASGVLPEVMEALAAANRGHVRAYGHDPYTERCATKFRELFDAPVEVLPVWGGTGANVVSLACLLHASDAVVCVSGAHINVDEGGAPERFTGAKLIDVPSADGKLHPDDLWAQLWAIGDEHHAQPKVVSITQSTELGTLYTADEIAALAEVAHANGLYVHLDGARIANATAALGGDVRSFTIDAGVDVLSFGGTKNGMMYGEAVVFLDPALASRAKFVRKQAMQLPSKTRFISSQFSALLTDDLWLRSARHANAMSTKLFEATSSLVRTDRPPAVNAMFPYLPDAVTEELAAWCHFYPWDVHTGQVRWMTAWDTTEADIDRFVDALRLVLSR